MNQKIFLIIITLFSFIQIGMSQTLFSVDGEDTSVKEFKYAYEKTNSTFKYSRQSVDEFLGQYKSYKLKIAEAKSQGLDKDPEVLREIHMYEDQLIQNEFDIEMMNDLLAEVEQRLKEEICARHVLIDVRDASEPADTLFSYNKAMDIRNQYLEGTSFERLAQKNSADIETKFNAGDLGCFTTLQLSSYDLENAIFKMKKGDISMPIRSRFGYHIVKVDDRRPSNGMVKATQLFVRANKLQVDSLNFVAKQLIEKANAELKAGEDFDEVAFNFLDEADGLEVSEDAIDWFTVGSFESDFENAIFNLKEVGDLSSPVQTSLGWHLFRLDGKQPLPSFTDIEGNVRDRIKEDERYFKSKMRFSERIKHKYDFEKNEENIDLFVNQVARGIGIEGWLIPSIYDLNKSFFTIGEKSYSARQFVDYVKEQHSLKNYYNFDYYYSTFESNHLLEFHKQNLIDTNPNLNELLKEYRNGILIFNLMEQEMWQHNISTESPEVKRFYEDNESLYNYPDEIGVRVYSVNSTDSKTNKKISKIFDKQKGESAIRKLNNKSPNAVIITNESLTVNEAKQLDGNLSNIGTVVKRVEGSKVKYMKSEKIIPGKSQPFNDIKSQVLMDYENHKQQAWTDKLNKKFNVTVNEQALNALYN